MGGKEDGKQEHPCQSLTDVIATKENKECVASEASII
jgi:aspartate carbamoyltransferase catalytic subunit